MWVPTEEKDNLPNGSWRSTVMTLPMSRLSPSTRANISAFTETPTLWTPMEEAESGVKPRCTMDRVTWSNWSLPNLESIWRSEMAVSLTAQEDHSVNSTSSGTDLLMNGVVFRIFMV